MIWLLTVIGLLVVLSAFGRLILAVLNFILSPPTDYSRYADGWVVVTGATDGIGLEMVRYFAAKTPCKQLLLIGRNAEKLETVKRELNEKYIGLNIRTIVADLSSVPNNELYNQLSSMNITILINNAAVSHPHPEYMEVESVEFLYSMVDLNVKAVVSLTHAILKGMKERKKGLVLNISSFAGSFPSPLLSVYSGTKAFVRTWSLALAEECRSSGVVVECMSPYFVVSKMSKRKKPTIACPSAATWASWALGSVGKAKRGDVTVPYPPHAFIFWIVGLIPSTIALKQNFNVLKGLRSAALKKK